MPAPGELVNEFCFEAPGHAAEALTRLSTPGPYLVEGLGSYYSSTLGRFHTFAGALECASAATDEAVRIVNLDRTNGESDGLTWAETGQLEEAIQGYCCRSCAVGICEDGDGLCIRCELDADDRDRIAADVAEFRAEIRGGVAVRMLHDEEREMLAALSRGPMPEAPFDTDDDEMVIRGLLATSRCTDIPHPFHPDYVFAQVTRWGHAALRIDALIRGLT